MLAAFPRTFHLATKSLLREQYPYWTTAASELFGVYLSLIIYWFTSKAFAPAFESSLGEHAGYFQFVILGEVALQIPVLLLALLTRTLKKSLSEGTFEIFLTAPKPASYIFSILTLSHLPREFLRVSLTLLLAVLFFQFSLSPLFFLQFICLQIAAIPLFLSFGVLFGACYLLFGRGDAILGYSGIILMTFSGAYFPLTVLPERMQQLLHWLSPYKYFLDTQRLLITGNAGWHETLQTIAALSISGVILFPLSLLAFHFAIKRIKLKGAAWIRIF